MEKTILILRNTRYEVSPRQALRDAMKSINVLPEEYLAIRNGLLMTEDEIVQPGDEIRLIGVISGG